MSSFSLCQDFNLFLFFVKQCDKILKKKKQQQKHHHLHSVFGLFPIFFYSILIQLKQITTQQKIVKILFFFCIQKNYEPFHHLMCVNFMYSEIITKTKTPSLIPCFSNFANVFFFKYKKNANEQKYHHNNNNEKKCTSFLI